MHSLTLTGQELLTRVRILSVEDGLSGRFINDIDRDDRGFIWILTNEAVNRFDGTTFKSYPKAAYGLSANIYDRIFTDTDGYLWLVNYAFGKNSQRITRYVRHIDRFDPAGELIVPGLDRSFSEAGVSVDSLTAIAAASDHRLYLGFRNGDIYLWDSGLTKIVSTGLYLNYIFPPPDDQSPVWCISRGRLASFNRAGNLLAEQKVPSLTGLRKLSDSRFLLFHHYERYFFDLNTAKLDSTLEVAPGIAVNGTDFTAFSSDPLGRTWCFKPGEFSVADPQKGWVIQGRGLTSEPQVGLPDDVFWDSQTTCWINFKSAVGVMIVEPSPFSRLFAGQGNSMRGIAPVNDSVLVAFSYSGSYLFNRNTLQPYPYPGQGLKVGIGAVADRDGNVLVGMHSDHVLRINLTKNERQRYPILFEEGNLVIETYPFIDRKGKVWLGSNQGLFYLDKTEEAFKRYVFRDTFEALNSANLHFFLETDEGTWIAGEKGLVFMDKTERIRNWYRGFDEDMINGLAIDPEGVFWIATRGAGLLKWKPDRGMIARWNTGNGLSNNFVNGVYPDRHGYLWLPTNYGLDRLDPGSGEVNIYLEQDGIAHNEFNFASGYQDEAGNFYFGGLNGLTVFDPDKVAQFHTESQPALEITQLLVMNSENGTMVNRTADLTRTGGIVMRPGEKALQLRFALLDYGRIGKQRYAYRVEELDKEWTYLNDGFISLNQLPYGRYKLRIKGLGRGGEWSVNELLIPLTVERPFYRTAWFLVVCLLFLAAAMRIYFLFRFQQFNKEKANLERQIADRTARIMLQNEELKSLNSIKDRMFSIIGHELRGPLVYFRGISLKLARLIEAGKGRTAAKLRAYLRAAFGLAMRAGLDPTLPEALTAFGVEINPADRLPSLAQFSKALDRTLTLPELRSFWLRVKRLPPTPARDAVLACMYLGGQRPAQLLRLTPRAVDLSGATLTLLDPKGRNRHAKPRRHVLPIHDELMPVIRRRLAETEDIDSPVFTSNGRVALRKETVAALVKEIERTMQAAGELQRGSFSLRDLRRTAETHLAAAGVSSDVRAQLQSHGLGGIQTRHYDRHDYMPEKREALALWVRRLNGVKMAAPASSTESRPRSEQPVPAA